MAYADTLRALALAVGDDQSNRIDVMDALDEAADLLDDTHPYRFRVLRNSSQTIPHNTITEIDHSSVDLDPSGMYDTSTNAITIPIAGIWLITASAYWTGNATGRRELRLQADGGGSLLAHSSATPNSTNLVVNQVVLLAPFTVGQTIVHSVFQTSGGDLDVSIGTPRDRLTGCLLTVP